MVSVGLVLLPFAAALFARWSRQRLRIRRRISDTRVQPGQRVHVELEIENQAPRRPRSCSSRTGCPRSSAAPRGSVVASLPARGRQRVRYSLTPTSAAGTRSVRSPRTCRTRSGSRSCGSSSTSATNSWSRPRWRSWAAGRTRRSDDERARAREASVRTGDEFYTMRAVRRGRRPAADPLAERRPQRRAHDPPGRVDPEVDGGPVRRHARRRRRADPRRRSRRSSPSRPRSGSCSSGTGSRSSSPRPRCRPARGRGEPARRARRRQPPLVPGPVHRPHAAPDGRGERHHARRRRGPARPDRALLLAPRGSDVRAEGGRVRPSHRSRHAPPDRRAQLEGRASQARMSLSRSGWEIVVLPPSRRLRELWHVERTQPLVTSGS